MKDNFCCYSLNNSRIRDGYMNICTVLCDLVYLRAGPPDFSSASWVRLREGWATATAKYLIYIIVYTDIKLKKVILI